MDTRNDGLTVGTQVRLVNDPQRIGVIIDDKPTTRGGRHRYKVQIEGTVERISEERLERVPDSPTDPLDLLEAGNLGTPADLRRALIHVRLTGRLADIIYSIEATNTTFYAYQFKPVLRMLQTPANGMLIADEVGLGKTIEAGLIWTELSTRFNFNRLFVLCPASLCEKWKDELAVKIGVNAEICNLTEAHKALRESRNRRRQFALISSMQGLRSRRVSNSKSTKPGKRGIHKFLEDMEHEDDLIDVLIVDEAHYMRNSNTATHNLGRLLRGVSTYVILLSATPVHNRNRDLHSLLCLIDPDMFAAEEYLGEILKANEPLIEARAKLLTGNPSRAEIAKALERAKRNHLLSGSKQLDTLVSQFEESDLEDIPTRLELAYRIELINLLSHTITRTRKREVLENRVVREPHSVFAPMTSREEEFYEMVTEIVTDYAIEQDLNESFLQVTPQQQMASCMPAALKSWQDKRSLAEQESDYWLDDPNQDELNMGPLMSRLVTHATQIFQYQELHDSDSKYQRLMEILTQFFLDHSGAKVIIFSTFRATVAYLFNRLTVDGMSAIMLRGGGSVDKYEILRQFESPEGPQLLLSTEVGGEGIDLQFCWAIVNYDIPWNPMRLEQRIGRVDRLGQTSDKVRIWNLLYDDTIDSRIYRRLYEKLDLCRKALGDFEPIIGDALGRLSRTLLTNRLTPEQQEDRILQTALALEEQRAQQERLEDDAADLVAYGKYILEEVHAARHMQRWISGADLRFYVTNCLDEYFPCYELRASNASNDEYKLMLPRKARHLLSDFLKKNRLRGTTSLNSRVTPIRCRFSSVSSGSSVGDGETISQNHPLIRFVSHIYSHDTLHLRPAVSVWLSSSNMSEEFRVGTYLLAISLWSVQGIRNHERLAYEVVEVGTPEKLLGNDVGEILASACIKHGSPWSDIGLRYDLSHLYEIANSVLFTELERRYNMFVASENALNSDRADILQRNLSLRFERQRANIKARILKLEMSGKLKTVPAEQGKENSLHERFKQRLDEIKDGRNVTDWSKDIAIAVVCVE